MAANVARDPRTASSEIGRRAMERMKVLSASAVGGPAALAGRVRGSSEADLDKRR